jgi:outer membrane receptor protein involved in Fe transport
VKFVPEAAPAIRSELNYFHILFKDRIQVTGTDGSNGVLPEVLEDPEYEDIVNRTATTAQRQRICDTTLFAGNQGDCMQGSIAGVVDLRSLNIATLVTQGLDLAASVSESTPVGSFSYGLWAAYLFDYAQKATPHAPSVSLLNTPHNPINLQLVTTVGWSWRGLGAQLLGNYMNGYHDPANLTQPNVRSWMTIDAGLQYQFGGRPSSWMNDVVLGVNVENLFNHGPPALVNRAASLGYDQENGELTGQIIRLRVVKQWSPKARI